jgi:diguanylate cyclase (GGDEF)-like protein
LFAAAASLALIPVMVLGLVLAANYGSVAQERGLAEGRSEAVLLAQTLVEPILSGRLLSHGLTASQVADLREHVQDAVKQHDILRLRLRDLAGKVVYSNDRSGSDEKPEAAAQEAADGATVARLTPLNGDPNDTGPVGPETVEVYLPLVAGPHRQRVGVLEVYLPYAPINADVTADLHNLYLDLAISLALLYFALLAITALVSRGLRRHITWNSFVSEHDALTDLPNRTVFHRRAEAVLGGDRARLPAAIAIIDLDRFKEVNDTLGHHNGDRLLVELGHRLQAVTRVDDFVARLGGDEFGVILTNVVDAERTLRRLRDVIDLEVTVNGLPLSVEASVGYVIAPEDGTNVDKLLQRADIAMYVAKEQRLGVVRYDPVQDNYDPANLSLIAELRHAIEAGDLVLYYQPKTRLRDGRVKAVEALVRWNHPTHGLLYPGRFLPLAEQTDLIFDLTRWVLDTALNDVLSMPPDVDVAVNVSARNLAGAAFAGQVLESLEHCGVPASRLIVEVTETALLADPPRAAVILGALDARGVQVSIDDFGRGQTSLGYLSSLPIHELKIDRSFVSDMLDNPTHAAIVRSIVDLGHNLSLRVVGEGVETQSVLNGLRDTGCDEAQGFFLARPMPLGPLLAWFLSPDREAEERYVRQVAS